MGRRGEGGRDTAVGPHSQACNFSPIWQQQIETSLWRQCFYFPILCQSSSGWDEATALRVKEVTGTVCTHVLSACGYG